MTRMVDDPAFLKTHIHTLSDELATCYKLIRYLASCVQRGGPRNWIDFVSAEMGAIWEAALEAGDDV